MTKNTYLGGNKSMGAKYKTQIWCAIIGAIGLVFGNIWGAERINKQIKQDIENIQNDQNNQEINQIVNIFRWRL